MQVMIIDFGCCRLQGQQCNWTGYLVHTRPSVLDLLERKDPYTPTAMDDAYSLVCILYEHLHPDQYEVLKRKSRGPFQRASTVVREFWSDVRRIPIWRELFQAAEELDYDKLRNLMKELLPQSAAKDDRDDEKQEDALEIVSPEPGPSNKMVCFALASSDLTGLLHLDSSGETSHKALPSLYAICCKESRELFQVCAVIY